MAKKKKGKSSFRGKVNKDAVRQKNENSGFGYLNLPQGVELYKPIPGDRENFDIIPYVISDKKHPDIDPQIGLEVGELWYKRPFKIHRGIGPNNDSFVCLTSFGEACPICDYRAKRAKEGASQDELKAYNASKRNLYNVIPRGIKKTKEEIHIFDFSQFNFQNLLNEELNENEDYEVFPDLEEGFTLRVRWSEETFAKNKFADANRIDFMDRDEEIDESILDDVANLDKVLKKLSYKELESIFLTGESSKENEEKEVENEEDDLPFKDVDEDEEEPKRKKKSAGKKAKKKEPEPEEEIEITWEDLQDMSDVELSEVVEQMDLDIDVDDFVNDEDGLMLVIAEDLEIEIPKKKAAKKEKPAKSKKESKGPKCPVKGGTFGVDTDEFEECDTCKWYDDCEEAND